LRWPMAPRRRRFTVAGRLEMANGVRDHGLRLAG
jgi:hypothetical protein